jgi:hypothetical protein
LPENLKHRARCGTSGPLKSAPNSFKSNIPAEDASPAAGVTLPVKSDAIPVKSDASRSVLVAARTKRGATQTILVTSKTYLDASLFILVAPQMDLVASKTNLDVPQTVLVASKTDLVAPHFDLDASKTVLDGLFFAENRPFMSKTPSFGKNRPEMTTKGQSNEQNLHYGSARQSVRAVGVLPVPGRSNVAKPRRRRKTGGILPTVRCCGR